MVWFLIQWKQNNGQFGSTMVDISCKTSQGNPGVLKAAAEQAYDINAANQDGSSPLRFAANCGHETACSFLVARGIDVPLRGVSVLGKAIEGGHPRGHCHDISGLRYWRRVSPVRGCILAWFSWRRRYFHQHGELSIPALRGLQPWKLCMRGFRGRRCKPFFFFLKEGEYLFPFRTINHCLSVICTLNTDFSSLRRQSVIVGRIAGSEDGNQF